MILASHTELEVSDQAFAYLRAQRGRIADLAGDRAAWLEAYNRELVETYHHAAPFLPRICGAVLDIGSGLGGIDVLLARHYCRAPQIWLLDGMADAAPGVCGAARHDRTFNSMRVARAFLKANGVRLAGAIDPALAADLQRPLGFDLVVSFQAWGFHLEPALYLDAVKRNLAPRGRVILDYRRGRLAWLEQILEAFTLIAVAARGGKFDRLVLEAR